MSSKVTQHSKAQQSIAQHNSQNTAYLLAIHLPLILRHVQQLGLERAREGDDGVAAMVLAGRNCGEKAGGTAGFAGQTERPKKGGDDGVAAVVLQVSGEGFAVARLEQGKAGGPEGGAGGPGDGR